MVPAVEIRVRLHALRTQLQLATLAGLRPETVSALERGRSQGIRFDTMAGLCETLGCTPGDLFELVDDGHRVPVFGADDEDDLIHERLKYAEGGLVDGPSFLAALLRERG